MIRAAVRRGLPSGTVTFLFTDVEGSTRLLHELGAEGYAKALAEHRRAIREACAQEGGVEVDTQGDAFFFVFPTASGAASAARALTESLASGPIHVRVGLHTGTALVTVDGYFGADVHRAARIAAAGHGGQVLVSAATAALVDLDLRELGEHRFKDLAAPQRVYQLGGDEFPPLATLYRTNLPVPATPFLGRERELGHVVELLMRDDVRLLTLTGPGGIGKTRLAVQAAAEVSDRYPDGVWWVPLASLRDPEHVLPSAAQALGTKSELAPFVADKRMLILFDNFEHVVEAARDLAGLRATCPNLELLVTSREPLHVLGEQEYAVPSLAHDEGVDFFLTRARGVAPAFEDDPAVGAICDRLDSLPLAIELAAARVKALSAQQILQRLEVRLPLLTSPARDVPERQRTLRATIEWSHDLLTAEERHLFARLSVFAGGCTLAAAEGVAKADVNTLESLVDKSLVRYSDERYWMLETIREFAAERVADSEGLGSLRAAHARHFIELVDEHDTRRFGIVDPDGLAWIASERDNINTAIAWAEETHDDDRLALATRALCVWWVQSGFAREGLRRIEAALERRRILPRAAQADLLAGATVVLRFTGDLDRALELSLELLEVGLGDPEWTAAAHADIAEMLIHRGELDDAEAHLRESVRLSDGPRPTASMAELALARGEYETAQKLALEAVEGFRGVHAYNLVATQEQVGEAARRREDHEGARAWFTLAARGAAELGDRGQAADCLDGLAALEADLGNVAEADRITGIASALREASGLAALRPERQRVVTVRPNTISLEDAIEQTVGAGIASVD